MRAHLAPVMTVRTVTTPIKPLGSKAYGSIGHLPCSRVGPGDWHVHVGQAKILTEKPRRGDRIIVTEKVDGACMSVANIAGSIVALTRSGYPAMSGTYEHLRLFEPFVRDNEDRFLAMLKPGERVCGEWLVLAHGTRYNPTHRYFSPFILFDIFRDGRRILEDEFLQRVGSTSFIATSRVHDSNDPCSVEEALDRIGAHGNHGSLDTVEGAVWRVEREGRVDFLAKYVRHEKQDGKYLPGISSGEPIWNWQAP